MYSSPFIMHTFISLLLFHLQNTCTAKDHSVLMRRRVQRRSLVDSPLSDGFPSSGYHPTVEEVSNYELTTPSSYRNNILVDKSDPEPEQIQQPWLVGQDPVDTLLLTVCTTNNRDESDQSLLPPPSAKFQRRQTGVVPNACPPDWVTQPPAGQQQQQNVKLDVQSQGSGPRKKNPDGSRPAAAEGEEQKVTPYPNALELYRLDTFGRAGESNSICDGFEGQSIPMCAPSSLQIPGSPPNMLAPCRFWSEIDRCISFIEQFWCCSKGRVLDPKTVIDDTLAWDNPDRSPSPQRAPSAYPAAGWMCWRSEDERAFRT